MSNFKFNCPHCDQSLEIHEDMFGGTIECPACDGSIQLPDSETQPATRPTLRVTRRSAATPPQVSPPENTPTTSNGNKNNALSNTQIVGLLILGITVVMALTCRILPSVALFSLLVGIIGAIVYLHGTSPTSSGIVRGGGGFMLGIIIPTLIIALMGGIKEPSQSSNTPPITNKVQTSNFKIPSDVQFSIINIDKFQNIKRVVDIRINKRISKDVLKTIALKIKQEDPNNYDSTYIGFYLPKMKVNSGYWATAFFRPNLEIKFWGTTKEAFERSLSQQKKEQPGETVIGVWTDELFPGSHCLITIYKKDNKLFMRKVYSDQSQGDYECVTYKLGNQTRIKQKKDKVGDYYVIDSTGNLWYGDATEGLWGKCPKTR